MRRFPEALQLIENINDEAASTDSGSAKGALSITHLDEAVLSSAEEHTVLLYTEAAVAHTRG